MQRFQEENAQTETNATKFFIQWLEKAYEGRDPSIKDIRRVKKKEVSADVKVEVGGKTLYFEIKSTKAKEKYWGRISFKEIISALDAKAGKYQYYFVIIKQKNKGKGFEFIAPRGAKRAPLLTLDEMLLFTNGDYFYGIDFVARYSIRGKQTISGYDTVIADAAYSENRYSEDELKAKREFVEKIAKNDRS